MAKNTSCLSLTEENNHNYKILAAQPVSLLRVRKALCVKEAGARGVIKIRWSRICSSALGQRCLNQSVNLYNSQSEAIHQCTCCQCQPVIAGGTSEAQAISDALSI